MAEIQWCDIQQCMYNRKGKCDTPPGVIPKIKLKGLHIRTWTCDMMHIVKKKES